MEGYRPNPTAPDFAHQTDPWHAHGLEGEPAPMQAHGEVSPKWISVALIAAFLATFAIIFATLWLFHVVKDQEMAAKMEVDTGADYVQTYAQSMRELESVRWADEKQTLARVPISAAMKDTVAWYGTVRSAPAAKPAGK